MPRPYHRTDHGPVHKPPSAAAAAPPGALLPAVGTATRFAPAGMKVAPAAAGSFVPVRGPAFDSIGSRVSADVSFPAPGTANRQGPGLPPRAASAVADRHAAQQAPVGAATHLDRAASAPVPSQPQQVVAPRPAIAAAASAPRQMIGGLTTSASTSCFNPLAAGLSHLSNQETADCAQVAGRAKRASLGCVGTNANRRQTGSAITPDVVPVCDAVYVGSPSTARAGGTDCKVSAAQSCHNRKPIQEWLQSSRVAAADSVMMCLACECAKPAPLCCQVGSSKLRLVTLHIPANHNQDVQQLGVPSTDHVPCCCLLLA